MPHSFDKEQKVSILLAALEERYKSIHTIRERVQSTGVWALGLLVAASGTLFQSEINLPLPITIFCVIGVLFSLGVLRFMYLENLERGFNKQLRVAVRLEKALGLFSVGIFDNEDTSVYPDEWKNAGSGKGAGKFFETTYLLLYAGTGFLLASIIVASSFQ